MRGRDQQTRYRRYRYYVCSRAHNTRGLACSRHERVPKERLEAMIIERIADRYADPARALSSE